MIVLFSWIKIRLYSLVQVSLLWKYKSVQEHVHFRRAYFKVEYLLEYFRKQFPEYDPEQSEYFEENWRHQRRETIPKTM